jgi:hypothetical protein
MNYRRGLFAGAATVLAPTAVPCFSLLSIYPKMQEIPALQGFLQNLAAGSLFFWKITLILAK